MTHEIRVPEVSEGVTEGTVVDIVVAVGDRVEVDQTLLELETDKAVIGIPSPLEGTITEIKVAQGDSVPIGAVIMMVESAGAMSAVAAEAEVETKVKKQPEPKPEIKTVKPPVAESPAQAAVELAPAILESAVDLRSVRSGDRVAPAAPSVRRLARDLGVDIYQVQGTGPGGRISEIDVRDFVRETMQRITGGGPAPAAFGEFPGLHAQRPLPNFAKWGEVDREPLSRIRELTADAMSYAWSTIPMVTQYD
ncbi:MAG: E3 binding domain-containing protein, partial [Desulfuromonadales bacterium]|nr:E3 binding domain-containing protein [Desulfuromonadales bacterium]